MVLVNGFAPGEAVQAPPLQLHQSPEHLQGTIGQHALLTGAEQGVVGTGHVGLLRVASNNSRTRSGCVLLSLALGRGRMHATDTREHTYACIDTHHATTITYIGI